LAIGVRPVQTTVPISRLIDQLKDRTLPISNRVQACSMLGERGAGAKEAVPSLMEAMGDSSFGVRCTAVHTLGRIGPAASNASPTLISSLRRWRTGGSSQGLNEPYLSGPVVFPPAVNKARNIDIWMEALTGALVAIRPSDPEAIAMLADLLDNADSDVAATGCSLLSSVTTNLTALEAKLIHVAQNDDEYLKVNALCALGKSKSPTPSIIAAVEGALADPRVAVQECALDLLAKFGVLSAPAVRSIVRS
jgi:HEAT repeat protein